MSNEMEPTVIDGGQGGKVPNNDALAASKSKETGPAKAPTPAFDTTCNIPKGQRVV